VNHLEAAVRCLSVEERQPGKGSVVAKLVASWQR
jgi:hypothetical protein